MSQDIDHQCLQISMLGTHPNSLPTFPHPSLYVGDFNCRHANWGYNKTSPDGESLDAWAASNNQQSWTVVQPKGNSQFLLSPLERWHQPRPGLREPRPGQTTAGQTCPSKVPAVTKSVLHHNATETQDSCPQRSGEALELSQGWLEALCLLTDESVERLLPLDTSNIERAYQDFLWEPAICGQTMYPTWPSEEICAMLGQRVQDPLLLLRLIPVGTDCDTPALSLLSQLGQKKQERWEEAVNSIDFSHSSCKAWRTINKLTGRSGHSFCQCSISATSITSQLAKNGAHRTGDRESTWLVNKELSDLWKIPKPDGHSISEPFRPE